jgi:hypothetical protein
MAGSEQHGDALRQVAAGSALLLLQFAATQAEIGPFARRGLATPQAAARCYGAMARPARDRRPRLA